MSMLALCLPPHYRPQILLKQEASCGKHILQLSNTVRGDSTPPTNLLKNKMEKTAIILITKNRQKLLHQTITSLFKNTPRELFDLIVVDDGSENTNMLHDLKSRGDISDLILTNLGSPGALRNLGVEIARRKGYKYIYQSDNDMYFLPGWIEKCQKTLVENENIKLVAPYGHPYHLHNDEFIHDDIYSVNACAGNSWYLSTENYLKYGLSENKGIMCSEDHDFCVRLRADGFICARFIDNLVLHTGITNSSGDPATGAEQMLEELSQAKINNNIDVYYE